MPVEAIGIVELDRGFCALLSGQGGEKLIGGRCRVGSRTALTLHRCTSNQQSETQQKECGFDGVECVFHVHILPANTSAM